MKRIGFIFTTLAISLMMHLVLHRYLSFMHVGPDVLFLIVLSSGFVLGPLMGESIGFFFGLLGDSLGIHLFGFQTFLYVIAGYISGKLRRRVDSERPIPQVIIAFVGTVSYVLIGAVMRNVLSESGARASFLPLVLGCVLNMMLMPFVFWFISRWVDIWDLQGD